MNCMVFCYEPLEALHHLLQQGFSSASFWLRRFYGQSNTQIEVYTVSGLTEQTTPAALVFNAPGPRGGEVVLWT